MSFPAGAVPDLRGRASSDDERRVRKLCWGDHATGVIGDRDMLVRRLLQVFT